MNRQECVDKIAEYLFSFTEGTELTYFIGNEKLTRPVTIEDERRRAGDIIDADDSKNYDPDTNDGWGCFMRSVDPIKSWYEEFSGKKVLPRNNGQTVSIKRKNPNKILEKRIKEKVETFKQQTLW